MTVRKLLDVMEEYSIPIDAHMMSDSGWECNETEMDGIWYNRETNTMIFTQDGGKCDTPYSEESEWVCVYGELKGVRGKKPEVKERYESSKTTCDMCINRKSCASHGILVDSSLVSDLYFHLVLKPNESCPLDKL